MSDRRVVLLSVLALLFLLAGLFALALPDPYEGAVLYRLDSAHSVRMADLMGLGLVAIGGTSAWGAGWLWQRRALG